MKKVFGKAMLCTALGLLCWMIGAGALLTRSRLWPDAILHYRAPAATQQGFEGMDILRREMTAQDAQARAIAWSQAASQRLEAEATGGTAQADALYVDGEASLIWNLTMLRGEALGEKALGCVLDETTAMSLLGSLDILGQWVTLGEQRLQVAGVAALPEGLAGFGSNPGRGLIFVPAQYAPEGTAVQAMAFFSPGKAAADMEEPAKSWLASAGMEASGAFEDREEGRLLGELFQSLPAWLLLLRAWREILRRLGEEGAKGSVILRRAWNVRRTADGQMLPAIGRALFTPALLCVLIGVTLLLPLPALKIPPSFLPTRWSDFAFWPALVRGLGESLAQARMEAALRPDVCWGSLGNLGLLFCAASAALLLKGMQALKQSIARSLAGEEIAKGIAGCTLLIAGTTVAGIPWVSGLGLLPVYEPGFTIFPLCSCLVTLCMRSIIFQGREGCTAQSKTARSMGETIEPSVFNHTMN